ncbi:MAG: phytoene desaturase [Actinobacteria bacterium]|nr:phytoene desaturase [Actinomycetota bacterium]
MSTIIVIGAGMGGMTAAARLAVKGHKVTVLERAAFAGGKVGRHERDGFIFDTGPSLLTLPQVYRDFFNKTGKPIENVLNIVELEPAFAYQWADGSRAVLPGADTARCADALGDALGGAAASEWRTLMARAADMWGLTRRDFMEAPLQGLKPLLRLAMNPRNIRTIAPMTSLRALGQRSFSDSRLVTLLDRYATYTGSDPRHAPAALATIPYIEQTFGAHHIAGGLRHLADQVYHRARERGVSFEFNCSVQRITTSHGSVTGVLTTDGRHIAADKVIANADAGTVANELLRGEESTIAARLNKRSSSLAGFCIYAAVDAVLPEVAHHNVWFCDNYDHEFDSVFAVGRQRGLAQPVPDPTIYACVPQDASMAPVGSQAWFILINAAPHGHGAHQVNWDAPGLAQAYAENVLTRLAQRGVDIRPHLRWMHISTPADLERSTASPGGAIYGTASHGPRSAFTRPANQTSVRGLYLVGGSAHPGGGLPLVGMSGAIVAELIGRANKSD